jgi:hypothetical protein
VLPPPITFLHVSANRIDVTGVPGSEDVSLQTATPTPDSDTDSDDDGDDDSDDDSDSDDPTAEITASGSNGNDYDVSYDVSDPNGDLDRLTVTVEYDNENGNGEDIRTEQRTLDVEGNSKVGTVTLSIGDPNYDEVLSIELTVTDDDENQDTVTKPNPN